MVMAGGSVHLTTLFNGQAWTSLNKQLTSTSRTYSQISVIRTSIIRNYWVIRRRRTVPTFFSIIYCNKTTDYSNFDYPKNSIFRSDSSVPMKEITIKITLQDSKSKCHAWWLWFLCLVEFDLTHSSDLANKVATGNWHRINVHTFRWSTVKWVNGVFN